jgi:hypothetical protein
MTNNEEKPASSESILINLAAKVQIGTRAAITLVRSAVSNGEHDRHTRKILHKGLKELNKAREVIDRSDCATNPHELNEIIGDEPWLALAIEGEQPESGEKDLLIAIGLANGALSPTELQSSGQSAPQSESDE